MDSCKYGTIVEATEAAVEIYIAFLTEKQKEHGVVAFVHPVLAILRETRRAVEHFSGKLRADVEKRKELHWLELLDVLLVNERSEFDNKYELDGTHVHPKYVSFLEKALSQSCGTIWMTLTSIINKKHLRIFFGFTPNPNSDQFGRVENLPPLTLTWLITYECLNKN